MADTPVSIAIPTRNQAEYIAETLDSAYAQTYANVVEVIVCDDASDDDTPDIVRDYARNAAQGPPLRYERNEQPLKIGGNFNRAVRLAGGDYVVKLDSDDILGPRFVETLAAALDQHPRAGWAHCNIERVRPDKSFVDLAHARKPAGYESPRELAPLYLRRTDTCHCVMLRAEAYRQAGGYRPEMLTCEDRLLWLEMIMAGYGCYYCDEPLARMRIYPSRERMSQRRRDYVQSIRLMTQRLEQQWNAEVARRLGLSKEQGLRVLRSALAATCLEARLLEDDPRTQAVLLEAAEEMAPSTADRLRVRAHRALPRGLIRACRRVAGMPRRMAKALWLKAKGR